MSCNLLDGLVALGHYAMRDVKDMGQQMGYRSLEWNWPKEAINIPIWAGIVDGALLSSFNPLVKSSLLNYLKIT